MSIGDPILSAAEFGHRVKTNAIDAKTALKEILAAYLGGLEFVVGGDIGELPTADQTFQLEQVTTDWPDPDQELAYPSASITVPDGTWHEAHSLAPTALEETWGVHDCAGEVDGTVLWKLGELAVEMQVDFWTNTIVGRDAIAARLPGAFAPGEGARRVMLEGSPRYWSLAARFSLGDWSDKDVPGAVYAHERRLGTTIKGTVDIVELRCARVLDPSFRLDLGYTEIG